MKDPATIWRSAYGELQLQLPRETFNMWLKDSKFLAHEDGSFIIGVANTYARDWLEQRLKKLITQTVSHLAGCTVELTFVVWKGDKEAKKSEDIHKAGPLLADLAPEEKPEPYFERLSPGETGLNPRQTFQTYAVGSCNRLAHAAAMAVVDMPATQFNPLYIHGGTGLGKTHLMHAIGNACMERNRSVLYVSAETFTNDLMAALRTKKTADLRDKYRTVDVLLIDDIEFLGGKNSTMEEFYHTFNDLTIGGAQIVIGASKPPAEVTRLDGKLRSRFEGGLLVEITQPDFLTRVDILEAKIQQRGMGERISLDTLETVAERIDGSVRELEGALNQVIASTLLTPNVQPVDSILKQVKARPPEVVTLQDIVTIVAGHYGVSAEAIFGRDRSREVSTARQVVMYLARERADIPLQQIGDELGGRHHSTVSYACDRVTDMMKVDSQIRRRVNAILRELGPRQSKRA
jgi:chromosomal replication initiator protein